MLRIYVLPVQVKPITTSFYHRDCTWLEAAQYYNGWNGNVAMLALICFSMYIPNF